MIMVFYVSFGRLNMSKIHRKLLLLWLNLICLMRWLLSLTKFRVRLFLYC